MNFPKDKNDWYLLGAASCAAVGFGVAKNFPLPDYTVYGGFWIPEMFAGAMLVRWVGASVWSDVKSAEVFIRMFVNSQFNISKQTEENQPRQTADGFRLVDRVGVEKAKSGFVINTQVAELPKLNIQQHFFTCVLRSYDLDPVGQTMVDMTEDTWVTKRKMFAQKPFALMKTRAATMGALKRRNAGKKAPFIVADRDMVVWCTQHPLPQL